MWSTTSLEFSRDVQSLLLALGYATTRKLDETRTGWGTSPLAGLKGVDGQLDGLWTCRRGSQVIIFNSTDKPHETEVNGQTLQVAPHKIRFN